MQESCKSLSEFYNNKKVIDKTDVKYNKHLKCISKKNNENFRKEKKTAISLYPHLDDPNFNGKINIKKEFNDVKYEEKTQEDFNNIIEISDKICISKEFELEPHQMFVRNFLSFQTPYNGLLLFHGLGTGKTCSAISVCEEMRRYNNQLGITKKIIIVASPAVQENFKIQLFDERKLKETTQGHWNIKACTGNSFLKEINPMNMRGLSRVKIISQIKIIIKTSYNFYGYVEFSNYLKKVMNKDVTEDDGELDIKRKQERSIKREYSNRMIVIDEIHNLRVSSTGTGKIQIKKESSMNIEKLALYTDNLKMMILSATPMFNSHEEIVWLLNVLNMNDNRFIMDIREVFDSRGNFLDNGKELLIQKSLGYVSYVRGENPFTFPNRIWPKYSRNNNSLLLKNESEIWKYPTYQINGGTIIEPIEILDLTIVNVGDEQLNIYNKLIESLKADNKSLNDPTKKIGFTKLEGPLQCLNMTYPHTQEDNSIIEFCYGIKGLKRTMLFNDKTKSNYRYKDSTLKNFGRIFSPSLLGKYSGKIKSICDYIKKSKGLVFIFSQYIDSGAIPIALALEEMGFTRNSSASLFKEKVAPAIDYLNMEPITDDSEIKITAKYGMITGNKNLTNNLKKELKLVTNAKNVDGKDIKVIIVTRAGSEGLDFSFIRQMHILDPWYNMNRTEQIIGRAVRNKSHCLLPYEKRNVEIFLYATLLKDDIESADFYVYRLAEKKSKKIGVVTRVLKENAVDCLLNRKGLDFSVDIMNKSVMQRLSSGVQVEFRLGDRENSAVCDYTTCSYKCYSKKIEDEEINIDTYNEGFIVMNIDKILQRIRAIYKEKYIYKKGDLVKSINTLKTYPLEQIYSALDFLITEKNEYIIDSLGRLGRLINVGEYYMFQPIEIDNNDLTYFERTNPVAYKRSKLEIQLPDKIIQHKQDKETKTKKQTNIYDEIERHYYNLINPSKIPTNQKEIWSKSAAWAIFNLNTYNGFDKNILIQLAINHLIDTLNYEDKLSLLNYIYSKNKKNLLEGMCMIFFNNFIIQHEDTTGIIIYNYNSKKVPYTILILQGNKWVKSNTNIKFILRKMFDKYQITDIEKINDIVGFITDFKKKDIVFKIKKMNQISMRGKSKGQRCDRGENKKKILERINLLLGREKYNFNKSDIISITNNENDVITDIKQISENTLGGEKKTVRINALQLCAETELIIRYFNESIHKIKNTSDLTTKNNKLWFFNSLRAAVNDIINISK